MLSPPVPSPLVKSPPCSMNLGMTLWNLLPLYHNLCPEAETPFSPVERALKFSTVFGTSSPKSPRWISPAG